ncbi:TylF/MycF family methyltransferase [Pelagibacteraceae bacterium]|nr:TylF/MycF family methyltransferase [Pelagibacteraceae bacterium]
MATGLSKYKEMIGMMILLELINLKKKALEVASKYSMTGFERMFFLIKALKQIKIDKIEGDFVECGVWRGGNLILFQKIIEELNLKNRKIFAYDTFSGMSQPGYYDLNVKNEKAKIILDSLKKKRVDPNKNIILAKCNLGEVKRNFEVNTKKNDNLRCIKGDVGKTLKIKKNLPKKISLLRLDTDWYQSTKTELEVLFPLLSKNGILIIDDYGYWKGSKKAVDEYFKNKKVNLFKVDFTARYLFKR